MTQDLTVFDRYRADVLFLLVGGNPLPNYVSAQLMAKENADIHLLATSGTAGVAQRLETKLQQVMSQARIQTHMIPEVGGFEIEDALREILEKEKKTLEGRRIGLNYTGGTKDMAVHVYDRLQDKYGNKKAVFSYLDARSLRMSIYMEAQPTQWPSAARAITPSLQDLWQLHGLLLDPDHPAPRNEPQVHLKDVVTSIAEIHSTSNGFRQWRQWLTMLKKEETLPDPEIYDELLPFINQIERACGVEHPTPAQAAAVLGRPSLRQCDDFLRGKWLEEWALWSLLPVLQANGLTQVAMSLFLKQVKQEPEPTSTKPLPPPFELDVVTIMGYQLFLLSCIATEGMENMKVNDRDEPKAGDRGEAKRHLFEAYSRARQVGGDEARVALVSCVANPDTLKAEVVHEWDAEGKIEVFGRTHLRDLSTHIAKWFRSANQQ